MSQDRAHLYQYELVEGWYGRGEGLCGQERAGMGQKRAGTGQERAGMSQNWCSGRSFVSQPEGWAFKSRSTP